MSNRLAGATSPYLQQHADNPVDWWPWGDEAFAEAERRGVPLLVSVGYSACHWCHVMAHESFEDADVAARINASFVPVKVDREERPDVDVLFMRATQALTGQGGWPMTVFATPQGRPFFAGTYYPPEPMDGMPSFGQVVDALADAWASRRDEVLESADAIVAQLGIMNALPTASETPDVWAILDDVSLAFDPILGGCGTEPKFPAPLLIDAMLVKGEPGTLDMAQRSLEALVRGGIHDQLGGGFHRYTVDAGWNVPHFEKMLSDNGLLLGAFVRGWRRTPDHEPVLRWLFERTVRRIVEWLGRDMVTHQGAFAASLDADSSDLAGVSHEGIYYVWNPELLTDVLGDADGGWASKIFHVTSAGTFEHGFSTLQLRGIPDAERLESICDRLLEVRDHRWAPARDDAVVASWNGFAIESLVWASQVFGEPEWLEMAARAASAVWASHRVGEELRRTSRDGVPGSVAAFAEDYGALASAFARLGGALGDSYWLRRSERLLDAALPLFAAGDGGFYDAAPADDLFERPRDLADNPTPSGTSCLVAALRVVGLMAGRPDFIERADAAARTTWGTVKEHPRFAGSALADLLMADDARKGLRPASVVVLDSSDLPVTAASRAAWRMAPMGSAIMHGRVGTTGFAHHFEGRELVAAESEPGPEPGAASGSASQDDGESGKITHATVGGDGQVTTSQEHDSDYPKQEVGTGGTVYVCRGETCFAPASTVGEIRAALWTRA